MPRYFKPLRSVARNHRNVPTYAEKVLWQYLRKRQLHGIRFYRQRPIGRFIADFLAVDPPLIIEIDGEYHNEEAQHTTDQERDHILKAEGYHILRFSNQQVLTQTLSVVETIRSTIQNTIKKTIKSKTR